ncbi:MAG TPA: 6-hydroxycyclohex-1-ene-1-carbonyl-CoA dehydrogenase [Planctomycetes bacterium]|nr:6-hydroxycyclohex-1-ene-1-carbonyl-CoA dehydrogenase [Planctomycetota bacterium]
MNIQSWLVTEPKAPMTLESREETPGPSEVLVQVAGCGVCHTDLGFYYDGVPTRHPLPLTLGHEISGTVVEVGEGAEDWLGKKVIVPAVMPCGKCEACKSGHGSVCPEQIFPGNDVHGGFATHVRVPALGLCPVPEEGVSEEKGGIPLTDLSVIADAVSTPYQAVLRSGLAEGELAIFVGVGGVGGFGVQIAKAFGAHTVAIDVDAKKLEAMKSHGADLCLDPSQSDFRAMKKEIRSFAGDLGVPTWRWKIFETSGTPQGQQTAFGLVGHGSHLSVVGFTPKKIEIRLSNLMAFDATAQGNWGCLPEHYPAILDLCLQHKVALAPFVEHRPLSSINETFEDIHAHKVEGRVILIPDV